MSSRPRASIVIPSYNHARFIEQAVSSVLDSYDDLQLVVIDDGSQDDSVERLRSFSSDPRFELHVQENQGAHAALNRGLDLARGEILFILNSDDVFDSERIETMVGRFDHDKELAVVGSWLEIIDAEGESLGVKQGFDNLEPWPQPGRGPCLADTRDPALALLETNYLSTTSNMAFRRQLIEEQGGLRFASLRYAHDWDFALAMTCRGAIELLERPLVRYRVHGDNTIAEGQQLETRGTMHFEILWVVARWVSRVFGLARERGFDIDDLLARADQGIPRFGCASLVEQLVALRGRSDACPQAYEDLLEVGHLVRRAAIRRLIDAGDP